MSKILRYILFALVGIIGIVILICVALVFFVDTSAYKPRVERVASEALGMEVRVGGRLGIGFFPGLRIKLDDVLIRNRGLSTASAKEANLEIALLPLLHKEVRIRRIELQRPRISIKRDRDGAFNFEQKEKAKGKFSTMDLDVLSLSDGMFLYEDERSREGFAVENFNLDVRSLRIAGQNSAEIFKHLSFTAEFVCREIRTKGLMFSDVKFTCKGKDGIFALDPVTLRLFGGQGSGSNRSGFFWSRSPLFRPLIPVKVPDRGVPQNPFLKEGRGRSDGFLCKPVDAGEYRKGDNADCRRRGLFAWRESHALRQRPRPGVCPV